MAGSTRLGADLWVIARPLRLAVGDIGTRMTVVRLADDNLFLHSPVRLDEDVRRALDDIGTVRWVVAPSKVHHFFIGDYGKAYPQARLFAAPGLAEKRRDLRFDAVLGDEPPPDWRGAIDQHLFRGAPLVNEVIFFHAASRTLLLTDLAFNFTHAPRGRARVFSYLVGATGRFGPHRMMRAFIRDRGAARESVRRVLAWDFDRITVTHGTVLESGGKSCFAAAFAFLGPL
jgi:hypothetical protein